MWHKSFQKWSDQDISPPIVIYSILPSCIQIRKSRNDNCDQLLLSILILWPYSGKLEYKRKCLTESMFYERCISWISFQIHASHRCCRNILYYKTLLFKSCFWQTMMGHLSFGKYMKYRLLVSFFFQTIPKIHLTREEGIFKFILCL